MTGFATNLIDRVGSIFEGYPLIPEGFSFMRRQPPFYDMYLRSMETGAGSVQIWLHHPQMKASRILPYDTVFAFDRHS
jgi:hypothetical protein